MKPGTNVKLRRAAKSAATHVLVAAMMFAILFPFYWMLTSSVKSGEELYAARMTLIPRRVTLKNYVTLLAGSQFGRYTINSVIVASTSMIISTLLSSLAAYSITRFDYRGRAVLSRLLLLTYMFPGILLLIPLYAMMAKAGLVDTLLGLVIVCVTFSSPFCTWLLRSFFADVPKELEEAAMVDGATRMIAFRKILLPLVSPGIATAAIYSFIASWSEYLFPMILIVSEEKKTLPLGLASWTAMYYVEWGSLSAAAVLTALPVLVLFAFLGKRFTSGLVAGALKQ